MKEYLFKISTKLKDEIKDPEGEVVEKIALRLGISKNIKIKKGKFYEIKIISSSADAACDEIKQLAEKILINPVVEVYKIEKFEEL